MAHIDDRAVPAAISVHDRAAGPGQGPAFGGAEPLALFSEELRRARSAAGLTQDQLAERVGYSPSLVAHVETGSRAPSLDFARRGDEALGTGGLLARLQPFVRSEAYPAWFRDWVEIEREAVSLRWFEPLLIPGLLQTEEYARAVLAAAHPAPRKTRWSGWSVPGWTGRPSWTRPGRRCCG
jgi:transcriptional regulator with XRE-family HTH domain